MLSLMVLPSLTALILIFVCKAFSTSAVDWVWGLVDEMIIGHYLCTHTCLGWQANKDRMRIG